MHILRQHLKMIVFVIIKTIAFHGMFLETIMSGIYPGWLVF